MSDNSEVKKAEAAARRAAKAARREEARAARATNNTRRRTGPELLVPQTSFDFLGGGYAVSRNTRMVNATLLVVLIAALIVTGAIKLQPVLSARSAAAPATRLDALVKQADTDVQRRYGVRHTESELRQHLQTRKDDLRTAIGGEVDFVTVATAIREAAPPGTEIISVSIKSDGASAPSSKASPAAGTKSTAKSGAVVEIKAKASGFANVSSWISAMQAVPALQDAEAGTTWSGDPSGGAVQITTTTTLTKDVVGTRYSGVNAELTASKGTTGGSR